MNLFLKTKFFYLKKSLVYLKNYKRLSSLVIIFSLLSSFFDGFSIGAIIPFFQNIVSGSQNLISIPVFKNLQNYIILTGSKDDILINLLIFALFMIILRSVFNYLRILTMEKIRNLLKRDLQNNIFNNITDSSLRFFHSMKSGEIVANVFSFTNDIVSFIFIFLNIFSNLSKITIYIIILLFLSWKLTILTFVFFILFFPIIRNILTKIKIISKNVVMRNENLYSRLVEILSLIPLIKISGTEEYEKKRFNDITTNISDLKYSQSKKINFVPFITEISIMAFIIAVLLLYSKILKFSVISFLPSIIAYLYVFLRLFSETNVFINSITGMFNNAPAFKSYEDEINKALEEHKEKSRTASAGTFG